MAYTKTTWVNNQAPAINADNLNKIEDGIYNSVRYADAQTLTDAQKTQARANIAAAPDGFGFGTLPPVISDPDSLIGTADGIYNFYNLDNPIKGEAAGILVHYQGNFISVSSSCHQIFYPGGKWAHHLERAYSGTWTEWEWVNPPMQLGVEYRTTERYLGYPVYVKLVDLGALPNAGSEKRISVSDLGIRIPISMNLTWGNSASDNVVINDSTQYISDAQFTNNLIWITSSSNVFEAYNVYALLKYSKSA